MRRVLALILVSTGFFMAACSSDSNTATNSTSSSSRSSSSTSSSSASAAAANATIKVATDAKYGQILVDSQGRTVYIFDKDMGTTSACTASACVAAWPAVVAAGTPAGGTGVTGSMLGTAQGQVAGQVTYNGHLLYRFAADTAPGDVRGAAIPSWHPVTPAGTAAT
jgi:predicted lipoprotein with Yx(FWY)xxD motif